MCVACGSPTGLRGVHKPSGVGCIALVIGILLVACTVVAIVIVALLR